MNREHLVMSAGTTQYVFGVEAGDAGKETCSSLTAAVTKTLWTDQRRRCKRNAVDNLGHRACG